MKNKKKRKGVQLNQSLNLIRSYPKTFSYQLSESSSTQVTASQNVLRRFFVRATLMRQWTMVQVLLTLANASITSKEKLSQQMIRRTNFTNLNLMATRKPKLKVIHLLMNHIQRCNSSNNLNRLLISAPLKNNS